MSLRSSQCCLVVLVGLIVFGALPPAVSAQQSTSEAVARELTTLLDAGSRDSIAARAPDSDDEFIAALYFPGMQLLVISAKYAVPQLLDQRITKGEHRDVYLDLQSASEPDTKFFVTDLNADGLKIRRGSSEPFDRVEQASSTVTFDNDWRRSQQMSEEEFNRTFAEADERYQQLLRVLVASAQR